LVVLFLVVSDFTNWYKSKKTDIARIEKRLDALEGRKKN
jgi:hypothetical protein